MRKILFAIFFLFSTFLFPQEQSLDTSVIRIGEQTKLSISCAFEKGKPFVWPNFNDTIVNGVEIIDRTKVDSTETENTIIISQKFIISAFDSGSYYFPPIIFNENLKTEGLILNVQTVELTEDAVLKDIKPPLDAPFGWSDIWPFLLGLFLIILIYLLLKKYVFVKKKQVIKAKPKVIIPANVIAVAALKDLEKKQLWQKGELKQYHSEISEILRTYLEQRFQILALELPTYDIIQNLKNKDLQKEDLQTLSTILKKADLAKYAKSKPTDLENEKSMEQSVIFVKNTKKMEVKND
ncbi:MAG: hypothetical protein H8E84_02240 [Flavobacteriales bacterium]|nr:hypothetical protein [Flavobacteriales bacterium]